MLIDLIGLLFNFVYGGTGAKHEQDMEHFSLDLLTKYAIKLSLSRWVLSEEIFVIRSDSTLKNA